jgi:hypothetical protein
MECYNGCLNREPAPPIMGTVVSTFGILSFKLAVVTPAQEITPLLSLE